MLITLDFLVAKYKLQTRGVVHVGGHELQEKDVYNKFGVEDRNILWFDANKTIVDEMKKLHPNSLVFDVVASDTTGDTKEFILTNNSQSNSIRELDEHKVEYAWCHEIGRTTVQTTRLDDWFSNNKQYPIENFNLLNCDTQGSELEVLKGLGSLLGHFDYVYLEVNFVHMYKDCALIGELDDYLTEFGFKRVETQKASDNWGDAFYIKQ